MAAHQQAITMKVTIRGRVQGVGYRAWVEKNATRLGLSGWVRNRREGTVEAEFHGPLEAVKRMIEECHTGPVAAQVSEVRPEPVEGVPGWGFAVKETV